MGEPATLNKRSWESLSSTFSHLEVSLSQDSSYASDEISVVSSNPTTVETSVVSNQKPSSEPLRPVLKSILKKPQADLEQEAESESGYGTDASDYGYEAISDEEDDEDDEMYDEVSIWGDASDIMSCCSDEEEEESDDGSFIAFESMVRFDENVQYIDAPTLDEDERAGTGLTCHEIMEMARSSDSVQFVGEENPTGVVSRDESMDDHKGHCGAALDNPEEHPGDMIDLDKQLFVAYVNGIKGIADSQYKPRIRALVDEIRLGQAQTPYLEAEGTDGVYLDHALNHVIGVFRNLLMADEFEELVALSEQKIAMTPETKDMESHNSKLMDRIQRVLVERLAQGKVDLEADELSFFAGGVTYALENWKGPCH